MDTLYPSSASFPPPIQYQLLKISQKRYNRKVRSFERIQEANSKSIRTLNLQTSVRSDRTDLEKSKPNMVREVISTTSCLKPSTSANQNPNQSERKASCEHDSNSCDPSLLKQTVWIKQEPDRDGQHLNLAWYRDFFNNRPLMRCLDIEDDEILADRLFKRLLEDIECGANQRLLAWLDCFKDDGDSLYEKLLQDTKRPVDTGSSSLPRAYRGEMNVRAWWDNVRAQLRDDWEE